MHTKEPWLTTEYPHDTTHKYEKVFTQIGDSAWWVCFVLPPLDYYRSVACVNALAGIPDPAAFMAKVRELCDHYQTFGIVEASPEFHTLCRELAAMLPPEPARG